MQNDYLLELLLRTDLHNAKQSLIQVKKVTHLKPVKTTRLQHTRRPSHITPKTPLSGASCTEVIIFDSLAPFYSFVCTSKRRAHINNLCFTTLNSHLRKISHLLTHVYSSYCVYFLRMVHFSNSFVSGSTSEKCSRNC